MPNRRFPCNFEAVAATAAVAALLVSVLASPASSHTRLAPRADGERGTAPHVVFSTLLGGEAGNFDGASDVTVDSSGNAVLVGSTESADFPTKSALQDSLEGSHDGFLAKFAPDGTLLFSTFLGGDEADSASAVAVDSSGAIYVAGSTSSDDFPVTDAYQVNRAGFSDVFVTKLSADGSTIVWSTLLGGSGIDSASDVTVDGTGRVIVTGEVSPVAAEIPTFPNVGAVQPLYAGGSSDAFVSTFSADGRELLASTLLDMQMQSGAGAPGRDAITAVRVLSGGTDVFVSGFAEFADGNGEIAFIARLDVHDGRMQRPESFIGLLFGAYPRARELLAHPETIGWKLTRGMLLRYPDAISDGSRRGGGGDLAMLAEGLCHPGPNGKCNDAVSLVRYTPDIVPTEFANLAPLNDFFLDAVSTDSQGALYIAGDLHTDRLTTINPFQPDFGGNNDVIVAALAPQSLEPAMVSFFGGDGFDTPSAITTDAEGNIFVAGVTTLSTTFPVTPDAVQSVPKGRNDAFLVKISAVGPFPELPDFALAFDPATVRVQRNTKVSVPLLLERIGGFVGGVKITPPSQVPGFKSPKKRPTVTGNSTLLKFKVKSTAPLGPTSFRFSGTDSEGRTRSATIQLEVVE